MKNEQNSKSPAIPQLPPATGSASERPIRVDMWDQECGSDGTVSNAIRRYTAQWGLPPMKSESETPNDTDQLRLSDSNRDNVGDNQTTNNVGKAKTGEPLAASGLLDDIKLDVLTSITSRSRKLGETLIKKSKQTFPTEIPGSYPDRLTLLGMQSVKEHLNQKITERLLTADKEFRACFQTEPNNRVCEAVAPGLNLEIFGSIL